MISRESVDYDARLKRIVLTDKARELQQKLCAHISETEARLVSGISERELSVFMSVIAKMSDNIDGEGNG